MPKKGIFSFFSKNKSQNEKKPSICNSLQNERRDLLQKQNVIRDEFRKEYPSALNTIVRRVTGESISTSEVVQSAITLSKPMAIKFDLKVNQARQNIYGCSTLMEREREEKIKKEDEFKRIEDMRKMSEEFNKLFFGSDRKNMK